MEDLQQSSSLGSVARSGGSFVKGRVQWDVFVVEVQAVFSQRKLDPNAAFAFIYRLANFDTISDL